MLDPLLAVIWLLVLPVRETYAQVGQSCGKLSGSPLKIKVNLKLKKCLDTIEKPLLNFTVFLVNCQCIGALKNPSM